MMSFINHHNSNCMHEPENNRIGKHLTEVDLIGKLADLKEAHYQQTLMLSALIELLEQQQIISREALLSTLADLDNQS